jgi:hypothetical protein
MAKTAICIIVVSLLTLVGGCGPLSPRSTCLAVGGELQGSVHLVVNGAAAGTTEAEGGYNCVESGHTGPESRLTYVTVDNPRVWTPIELGRPTGLEGRVTQELFSDPAIGWRCEFCDLSSSVSLGDGAPTSGVPNFSDNVSGHLGSLSDMLPTLDFGFRALECKRPEKSDLGFQRSSRRLQSGRVSAFCNAAQ